MQRIKIVRKALKPRPRPEILPLDPRDPAIVHAKALPQRTPEGIRHPS
jgi:hypothetical protein